MIGLRGKTMEYGVDGKPWTCPSISCLILMLFALFSKDLRMFTANFWRVYDGVNQGFI